MSNGNGLESELSQEEIQRKVDQIVSGVYSKLMERECPEEEARALSVSLNQLSAEWLNQRCGPESTPREASCKQLEIIESCAGKLLEEALLARTNARYSKQGVQISGAARDNRRKSLNGEVMGLVQDHLSQMSAFLDEASGQRANNNAQIPLNGRSAPQGSSSLAVSSTQRVSSTDQVLDEDQTAISKGLAPRSTPESRTHELSSASMQFSLDEPGLGRGGDEAHMGNSLAKVQSRPSELQRTNELMVRHDSHLRMREPAGVVPVNDANHTSVSVAASVEAEQVQNLRDKDEPLVHELRHESQLGVGARGEVTTTLENRDQRGVSVAAERAVDYGGASLYDNEDAERRREARSEAARLDRYAYERLREGYRQMEIAREMESNRREMARMEAEQGRRPVCAQDPYTGDASRRNVEVNRQNLVYLGAREAQRDRDYEGSKADLENRVLRREVARLRSEAVESERMAQQVRDRQSWTQAGMTQNREGLAQLSKQQDIAALAQEHATQERQAAATDREQLSRRQDQAALARERATQERQEAAIDRERLAERNLENRTMVAKVVLPMQQTLASLQPLLEAKFGTVQPAARHVQVEEEPVVPSKSQGMQLSPDEKAGRASGDLGELKGASSKKRPTEGAVGVNSPLATSVEQTANGDELADLLGRVGSSEGSESTIENSPGAFSDAEDAHAPECKHVHCHRQIFRVGYENKEKPHMKFFCNSDCVDKQYRYNSSHFSLCKSDGCSSPNDPVPCDVDGGVREYCGKPCRLRSKLELKQSQPFMSNVSAIDTRAQPEITNGVTVDRLNAPTGHQLDGRDLSEKGEKTEPGGQAVRSVNASQEGTEEAAKAELSERSVPVGQDGGGETAQLENSVKDAEERKKGMMEEHNQARNKNAELRARKQKAKLALKEQNDREECKCAGIGCSEYAWSRDFMRLEEFYCSARCAGTLECAREGCEEVFSILSLDNGKHEYTQAKYCSPECEPCASLKEQKLECGPCEGSPKQKLCSRDHCRNIAHSKFEVGGKTFCNVLCAKAYRVMILRQGNPETAPDGVCAREFCAKQAIAAFRQGGRPYCCILCAKDDQRKRADNRGRFDMPSPEVQKMLRSVHNSSQSGVDNDRSEAQSENPTGEMDNDEHGYALVCEVALPHDHWIHAWERARIQEQSVWALDTLRELILTSRAIAKGQRIDWNKDRLQQVRRKSVPNFGWGPSLELLRQEFLSRQKLSVTFNDHVADGMMEGHSGDPVAYAVREQWRELDGDSPIHYLNHGEQYYSVAEVINFLYDSRVWQANMTKRGKQSPWHQQVLDVWKTADSETLNPKEWLQWFAAEYEWAELDVEHSRIRWRGRIRDLNTLRSIPDVKKGFSLHGHLWNLEAWRSSAVSMGGADLDLWQGVPAGVKSGQKEGKESHNEPSRGEDSGSRHSPSHSRYSTGQGTRRKDLRSGAGGGGFELECKARDCVQEPMEPFEPHCSRRCKLRDGGVDCWVYACEEAATEEFDPACSYRCGQQWAWSNQQSQQPPKTPPPSKDGSCIVTWCPKQSHPDWKPFCSGKCKMSELGYPGATPTRRECQYLNCGNVAVLEEFPFCSSVCRRKGEQPSHPMDREQGGDHRRKSIYEVNVEEKLAKTTSASDSMRNQLDSRTRAALPVLQGSMTKGRQSMKSFLQAMRGNHWSAQQAVEAIESQSSRKEVKANSRVESKIAVQKLLTLRNTLEGDVMHEKIMDPATQRPLETGGEPFFLELFGQLEEQWMSDYPCPKDVVHQKAALKQLLKYLQDPPMYWQQAPIAFLRKVRRLWAKYYNSGGVKVTEAECMAAAHENILPRTVAELFPEEWKETMSVGGRYKLDEQKVVKFYQDKGIDAEKALTWPNNAAVCIHCPSYSADPDESCCPDKNSRNSEYGPVPLEDRTEENGFSLVQARDALKRLAVIDAARRGSGEGAGHSSRRPGFRSQSRSQLAGVAKVVAEAVEVALAQRDAVDRLTASADEASTTPGNADSRPSPPSLTTEEMKEAIECHEGSMPGSPAKRCCFFAFHNAEKRRAYMSGVTGKKSCYCLAPPGGEFDLSELVTASDNNAAYTEMQKTRADMVERGYENSDMRPKLLALKNKWVASWRKKYCPSADSGEVDDYTELAFDETGDEFCSRLDDFWCDLRGGTGGAAMDSVEASFPANQAFAMRLLDESSDEDDDIDADAAEPGTDSDSEEQVRHRSTEPEVVLAPSMDTYGFENLADEATVGFDAECDCCPTCNNPFVAPGFPHCFTCQGNVEVEASDDSAEVQHDGEEVLPSTPAVVWTGTSRSREVVCNAYGGLDQDELTPRGSQVDEVQTVVGTVAAPVPGPCFWHRGGMSPAQLLLGVGQHWRQQLHPVNGTACAHGVDDWVPEEGPNSL